MLGFASVRPAVKPLGVMSLRSAAESYTYSLAAVPTAIQRLKVLSIQGRAVRPTPGDRCRILTPRTPSTYRPKCAHAPTHEIGVIPPTSSLIERTVFPNARLKLKGNVLSCWHYFIAPLGSIALSIRCGFSSPSSPDTISLPSMPSI